MKFQKVMIALGLSTCLISAQAVPAVAQDQTAEQQEISAESVVENPAEEPEVISEPASEPAAQPVQEAEPETGAAEEPEVPDTEESEAADSAGTQPETPEVDNSDGETPETGEEPETEEDTSEEENGNTDQETGEAADGEDAGETEEPEDGGEDTGENTDCEEDSEEPGEDEDQETGEAADSSDDEEKDQEESSRPEDGEDTKPSAPAEKPSGTDSVRKSQSSITLETVLNMESYLASNKFLDNRDKIKYNVDLPLENIPSFITQEMIVGALKCQDETGYPASVTIAQIIQESGYGKYGPGGEDGEGLSYLAYQYNNLFGIKGSGPAGSVDMRTGEQTSDGTGYTITAGFRVYNTYTECIEDRAELLERVYKDLTAGVEDANTFALRVGSRWATDVDYGLTLIRVMERYDLYRLDEMTLGEFSDMLGTFVNPCPGAVLTSDFGYRTAPTAGASTNHKGIDLGTGEYNIPTYAAAEGTVIFAGEAGSAGNLIVIDHGDGLVTKYMHHDSIYVEEGDEVEKGQQIGLSGTTGVSTGNHLHFQVEEDGHAVDPLEYLNLEENQ